MGVKTYQAYTISEALDAAKHDLGADAVVLETRTFKRGGFLGVGRRSIFELTATTAERPRRAGSGGASASGGGVPARVRDAYRKASTPAPADGSLDQARTKRLAQALMESHERRLAAKGAPADAAPAVVAKAPEGPVTCPPAVAADRVARRFILTPAAFPAHDMKEELVAIRQLVGQVLERQAPPSGAAPAGDRSTMPGRLFDTYLELVGQEVSQELASRVIAAVRRDLSEEALDDSEAVREAVLRHLAEFVPVADPVIPRRSLDGRPFTIALIGPTGVGKTTTLAKLAASFKLRHRCRVGLVTCDTYRIAAVDQLRTYANIIGIPLEIALTPPEMHRAVTALRECDAILIDTAGRGPGDAVRLDELQRCLEAADPHEVHLVLSSTASERVLLREAEAFAGVGADRVVITKLDEAVTFGVLVNVMQKIGHRLSFVTTGQEVPDHIEAGRPRRLAELVLGAAVHS